MAKTQVSCTITSAVMDEVKRIGREEVVVELSVSQVIEMLLVEAIGARNRVGSAPKYQRPAFNPVPKPGSKS